MYTVSKASTEVCASVGDYNVSSVVSRVRISAGVQARQMRAKISMDRPHRPRYQIVSPLLEVEMEESDASKDENQYLSV